MSLKFPLLLIFSVFMLSGCGGGEKIETEDDSADYRSARALPPLIKDVGSEAEKPATSVIPEAYVPEQANNGSATITIISKGDDRARLQINRSFEGAWIALGEKLKNSGITVHNRNKNAGRIAVGCGELGETEQQDMPGGWSIFRSKPTTELEYCALQMLPGKQNTEVQVLNRNAQEVDKASAQRVFVRLLGAIN